MDVTAFLESLFSVSFFPFVHIDHILFAVPVGCMVVCGIFSLIRRLMLRW